MNPEDIFNLTSNFNEPVVFKGILKWKILSWNLQDWCNVLKKEKLAFRRIPFIRTEEPIWEAQCEKVFLTMAEFIKFQNQMNTSDNSKYGLYFDYKYMKDYFQTYPEIMQEVRWGDLGYPEITGNESTIWIGSAGSHTLCHQDCYGYNLIAQIYGNKEWILFPPETNLYQTRVPFEESTVFSKLNFFCPNVDMFDNISGCKRIILNPGDLLFLPHGWWHYVENLNTAISINTWVPMDCDHKKRIEEGLISIFIQGIVKNYVSKIEKILNSSNEFLIEENADTLFEYLQKAVVKYKENKSKKLIKTVSYNCIDIIKNSDSIKILETLSDDEFQSILKEKLKRYNFIDQNIIKDSNFILENVINSFCNPENISKIADDFIKRNT